jgi:hypothetical protein
MHCTLSQIRALIHNGIRAPGVPAMQSPFPTSIRHEHRAIPKSYTLHPTPYIRHEHRQNEHEQLHPTLGGFRV